jgi:hypothetical protein
VLALVLMLQLSFLLLAMPISRLIGEGGAAYSECCLLRSP